MNELKCIRCLRTQTIIEDKYYNSITKGKVYPVLEHKNKLYRIKNDDDSTILWYEEYLFQELVEYNNELNIIEASNMPYGTEFKVKIDCYYKYDDACRIRDNTKLIAINTQSGIKFKEYVDIERASKTLINAKFIPIPKTVTFEEARKEYRENKITIKSCVSERVFRNGIDTEIGFSEIEGQWIVLD